MKLFSSILLTLAALYCVLGIYTYLTILQCHNLAMGTMVGGFSLKDRYNLEESSRVYDVLLE